MLICAIQMAMEGKQVYVVADDTDADSMILACALSNVYGREASL